MNSSISILLLFVAAASALTLKAPPSVDPRVAECSKQHNVKIEDVSGSNVDIDKLPSDRNIKCYTNCILKKRQLLKADGKFNSDAVISSLALNIDNLDAVKAGLKNCENETDADECEAGFKISKCLADVSKTIKFGDVGKYQKSN